MSDIIYCMFSMMRDLQKPRAIFLILTLITLIAYSNSINNAFVSDDVQAILLNPNIQNFGHLISLPAYLGQDLSNFFIYKFFGANPAPYRLFNIFFHILNSCLIYTLLKLLKKKKIAFFAACIFAVHPVFVESVTWISGGGHSRYATFFLLSFIFYIRSSKNIKQYILSISAFAVALLINIKAISLPLVFLLYESMKGTLRQNWGKSLIYFLLSIAMLALVTSNPANILSGPSNDVRPALALSFNLQDNVFLRIPYAIYSYITLFAFPVNLTFFHLGWIYSWYEYLIIVLVFLLYCGSIVYFFKKNRFIFFWLVFFIIPVLPMLTPVRVSWIVAERYAYISGLAFAVLVAMSIQKIISFPRFKIFGYVLFVVLITALTLRTVARNNEWKSETSFWEATARVSFDSYRAFNDLGNIYLRNQKYQKAEDAYAKSLSINPGFSIAHFNRSILYNETDRPDAAIASAKTALALHRDYWPIPQMIGMIYYNKKDYLESEKYLLQAKKMGADNAQITEMLSVINAAKEIE